MAHLFASTTGSDADWVVKLIDVYPEQYETTPSSPGYQLMVANDVFRGRYRKSFEQPEADRAEPDSRSTRSTCTPQNYRFQKGHKIRVQVQSTWFPLIDRNPQTFVPNIFEAEGVGFPSRDAAGVPLARAPPHSFSFPSCRGTRVP